MGATLAFVVLVVLALLGWEGRRWLLRRGVRAPGLEGLSFVLVGVLLGERFLQVLPPHALAALRAVVLLGLAWVGLLVGLQLDLGVIRRLAPPHRRIGLLLPLLPGAFVGATAWAMGGSPVVALTAAAMAMVASPQALDAVARGRRPRDRAALRLLKLVMSFSSLPAIATFGLGVLLLVPQGPFGVGLAGRLEGAVVVVGLAVVVGYLAVAFLRGEREEVHILAMLVGAMALTAGLAVLLGTDPLLPAGIVGAVVVGRCAFPHRLLRAAHALETPMLVALLVLLGASLTWDGFSWRAFALLTVVRGAAWLGAGMLLRRIGRAKGAGAQLPTLGAGLLPMGPVAVALAVAGLTQEAVPPGVIAAVVAALAVNHAAGHVWTDRVLLLRREA